MQHERASADTRNEPSSIDYGSNLGKDVLVLGNRKMVSARNHENIDWRCCPPGVIDEHTESGGLLNRLICVADREDVNVVDRTTPNGQDLERPRPIEVFSMVVDVDRDVHIDAASALERGSVVTWANTDPSSTDYGFFGFGFGLGLGFVAVTWKAAEPIIGPYLAASRAPYPGQTYQVYTPLVIL